MKVEIDDRLLEQLLDIEDPIHKPDRSDWKFFEDMFNRWINQIVSEAIENIKDLPCMPK